MSANHDLYLDLCAALAVGSIEPSDRRELEAHLAGGCAECTALLQDLSAPVEALARSVDPVKPGRGLKARTLVAVAQADGGGAASRSADAPEPAQGPALRLLPRLGWAVAAALLVAAGAGWWRASTLGDRVDELAAIEPASKRFERFVASAPAARRLSLGRRPGAPAELEVELVFDEARQRAAVRVVKGGPPAGQVLELWTLREGKPHSEGLIPADGVAFIENTGERGRLGGFAVSVEPPQGAKDRATPSNVALLETL